MLRERLTAVALAAGLAACVPRELPYRFQAPVVSAVRATPLPPRTRPGDRAPGEHPADGREPVAGPAPRESPDRTGRAATAQPGSVSGALRTLAGSAQPHTSSARFAMATLAALGATLDDRLRGIATGADLLVLAEARGALTDEPPLTGDLVLLEPPGDAGLLVGIVVAAGARPAMATEVIYLADGAVHRGFVTPARPSVARDPHGARRDSEPCHGPTRAPGAAGCLAGLRVRAYLHLDRLTR